jgi:quercetin dioxygenase-like cupin family protein
MTSSRSVQKARFADRLAMILGASLLICVLTASLYSQQDRQLVQNGSQTTGAAKRIALVIGNGAYTSAPPLKNPPNDAREMARALRELGFDVTSGINVNQKEMKRLVRELGQKLKSGGSGLFYYAGHGVQSKGRNFLIPVDADIQSEAEVEDSAVDVSLVLNYMDDAQNGLNIVILDACRNNPFARSFRSASGGLAQVDAPTGTLIAYATAPGRVASDGQGQNGLYTFELLKQMRVPGQSVTDMFMHVRAEVMKQTAGKQVPWEASSLVGNFYFSGLTANSAKPLNTDSTKPAAVQLSAEAHHHPKFENEFVRVWDVTVEPQDETLWHIHHYDDVVISFGNAKLRVETIGATPVESQWKFGEVRFNKAAYTHRALNIGTTPFHNLTIELLKPGGGSAGSPKRSDPAANAPILENDRVRIFQTILQPGQSTPMHFYRGPRLAIVISSGEVDVTTEGKSTPDHLTRAAGEVYWRPTPLTFALKNVGKTTFEIVDIELK